MHATDTGVIWTIKVMIGEANEIMQRWDMADDGVYGALRFIEVRRAEAILDAAAYAWSCAFDGPDVELGDMEPSVQTVWGEICELRSKIDRIADFVTRGWKNRAEGDDLVHVNLIFR